jgi:hypothetical protein
MNISEFEKNIDKEFDHTEKNCNDIPSSLLFYETLSKENIENNYCLLINKQLLDLEIIEKELYNFSNSLFHKVISSIDGIDIIILTKIEHLIKYIVIRNITETTQFTEDIDKLLLFSLENRYEDIRIHEAKEVFDIIKNTLF